MSGSRRAIAESSTHLTIPQIMVAGISTASVMLILGATGLMSLIYRFIPLLVRGIQLSQGISFAFAAVKYIRNNQNFSTGESTGARPWLGLDGLILALSCLLFVILTSGSGTPYHNNNNNGRTNSCIESESSNRSSRTRASVLSRIPSTLTVFLL